MLALGCAPQLLPLEREFTGVALEALPRLVGVAHRACVLAYFLLPLVLPVLGAVDVAKVVGHSSPAFTLNQYANAVEEGQKRSAAAVARSLGLGS